MMFLQGQVREKRLDICDVRLDGILRQSPFGNKIPNIEIKEMIKLFRNIKCTDNGAEKLEVRVPVVLEPHIKSN